MVYDFSNDRQREFSSRRELGATMVTDLRITQPQPTRDERIVR
jgi:hypothetical protein